MASVTLCIVFRLPKSRVAGYCKDMSKAAPKGKKKDEVSIVRYDGGVSKSESAHPRYPFVVRWPGENGKRLVKWFTNDTDAKLWAKEKSAEAGELGAAFGSLHEDERAAVAAFRALVAKYEHPKPPRLDVIVKEFAKRWEASRAGATVAASVAAFLEAKKAEGQSESHRATIGVRLGRFVKDHGDRILPSFTTAELSDYLLGLRGEVLQPAAIPLDDGGGRRRKDGTPVKRVHRAVAKREDSLLSLETRKGYRASIHSFFAWAESRNLVQTNPVTKSAKLSPPPKIPGTLEPGDVKAFFAALSDHAPALVPFWAVRAFAGPRESEAVALDCGMVNLAAGRNILPPTITKTAKGRTVEILHVLAAFLRPYVKPKGEVIELSAMARRWHLRVALRAVPKLVLPRNWARHSFATFHLLEFENAGKTAVQLGHRGGLDVLHQHYDGEGTKEEAAEFWAIRPAAAPSNVVPIDQPADAVAVPEETTQAQKAAR